MTKRSADRRSPFAGNREQGSKWIRKEKRLAIYERDGWRCVWCRCDVIDGASMQKGFEYNPNGVRASELATLDHFLGRARGGSNDAANLLTCCASCNAEREDRSALEWATLISCGEMFEIADEVHRHRAEILERALTQLDKPLAKRAKGRAA